VVLTRRQHCLGLGGGYNPWRRSGKPVQGDHDGGLDPHPTPSSADTLERHAVHTLKMAVRALCIIPFVTGIADIINGVGLLTFAGARLENVASDPTLNSQVGFWGAIWFGFGIILWRASSHLQDEADLFRLLCGTIALSGLARLGSAFAYGLPGPVLTVAMSVELSAGMGFLFWHASALRRPGLTAAAQPSLP